MVDCEQVLDANRVPAPREGSFGRGFRDATLFGINWLKGNRDRAYNYSDAQLERVTDAKGNFRYNPRSILDWTGYFAGGLLIVCPMGIRDLVQYVLKRGNR